MKLINFLNYFFSSKAKLNDRLQSCPNEDLSVQAQTSSLEALESVTASELASVQVQNCPNVVPHLDHLSKYAQKKFFYLPSKHHNSPLKAIAMFFATLVLLFMIISPASPASIAEGLFQLIAWGPNSRCESGWTCNAPGDVTWFGEVK